MFFALWNFALAKIGYFWSGCLTIAFEKCPQKKAIFRLQNLAIRLLVIFRAMVGIEKLENGSRDHKYALRYDRSCFLALLNLSLKSPVFYYVALLWPSPNWSFPPLFKILPFLTTIFFRALFCTEKIWKFFFKFEFWVCWKLGHFWHLCL